jgi:hypothetical protein
MGEVKRRSKFDPNYGKIFDLSSTSAKIQHSELVVDQLFTTFSSEFKTLISAQAFPNTYQSICDRISDWLHQRLLQYRPSDLLYIASLNTLIRPKSISNLCLMREYCDR